MNNPFNAFFVVTSLALATPILLAAAGELIAERSGVLNIGLEGMMLAGAFFGFLATSVSHNVVVGTVAAIGAGAAFGCAMAALALLARADQIVVGVGINLIAAGLTSFLFEQIYGGAFVSVNRMGAVPIPGLSELPFVGSTLFSQPILVYAALLSFPLTWFVMFHTRWGLTVRATGEHPAVTDTAGLSVITTRWLATMIAGAMAGLGGAFLSLSLGSFAEGMTNGRGFLAIAAVIFGRWKPSTTLLGCLLFGAADALQLELQSAPRIPAILWLVIAAASFAAVVVSIRSSRARRKYLPVVGLAVVVGLVALVLSYVEPAIVIPPQLWGTLPYVLSLLVLAGFVGRARMPSALAIPYRREIET